jgi:carbon-monoxide dehydrogenase medium subunit
VKPAPFAYARPGSVADAVALGASDDITVRYMAGGQSLGPMLNLRLVAADLVVDLTGIADLTQASATRDGLTLGACVTHADIEDGRVPDVTNGALAAVARGIAYRAVRNRGTVGGSLCHADPAADWASTLAMLGASAVVVDGAGRRTVPLDAFMMGAFETVLAPGALVESVHVPRLSPKARWGYYKICRKVGEFAHAIGAVLHDPDRSVFRAVIGAVEAKPIVFADATPLFGGRLDPHALDTALAVAALAAAGIAEPITQKLHVTALRRAAEEAVAR